MDKKFIVSSSPHIRENVSTSSIMLDVIIALLPTTIFAIYKFGVSVLIVNIVAIAVCVLSEFLFNILLKRKNTITDLSAVVTGLLIGLNMPDNINLYIVVLTSVFAIVVVKMLFGGLGQNFMNPALGGRAFAVISFTSAMNTFYYDEVTSATPLALLKNGSSINVLNSIVGDIPGVVGEVSKIAILLGFIYLLIRKVISYRITLSYVVSFVIFILIFGRRTSDINFTLIHLFSGGLLFGAVFMATDYATSPITNLGQVLYGIFLGILTGVFRLFSNSTEGVTYAILIGNLIVPFLENITMPKAFGKEN